MDFFERQEQARKATQRLIVVYALFVVAVVACIHFAVSVLIFAFSVSGTDSAEQVPEFAEVFSNPEIIPWSIGITCAVILLATLYKAAQLQEGGPAVALSMGAREVLPNTRDNRERRLLNVVEEIALASGVPAPRVFIMDDEDGINAFAAGYSPNDAAVAVTKGALVLFNREELQSVIGHEFSHILNGDMRLNIKAVGVLFGILCISMIGSIILRISLEAMRMPRMGRRNKKDNTFIIILAFMLFGAAVWLIGSIGVLGARMMQATISRQREDLADASSIQFTRNPVGMANALKIIGASSRKGLLSNAHASEVSHMLFASGLSSQLFATHPPLKKRIREIDPAFNGDYSDYVKTIARRRARDIETSEERVEEATLHSAIMAGAILNGAGVLDTDGSAAQPRQTEAQAQASLGKAAAQNPAGVPDAIRTAEGASACLFASLLASDGDTRAKQTGIIRTAYGEELAASLGPWSERLSGLDVRAKRVECEMAVNTLRVLPKRDIAIISDLLDKLVYADARIDAFEFACVRLFKSRLMPDISAARAKAVPPTSLAGEAAFVMHVLAHFGTPDRNAAEKAWQAGAARLENTFGAMSFADLPDFNNLGRFDASLTALVRLPPTAKQELMEACKTVVTHDHKTTDIEYNFLHAVSDVIQATGWQME